MEEDPSDKVLIFDFQQKIETMMAGYDEGWAVFDRYMDRVNICRAFIKNKTRQKSDYIL